MSLPSELAFTSFLQYAPHGKSEVAKKSRAIRDAVKNDRRVIDKLTGQPAKAVDLIARWLKSSIAANPLLSEVLGPETTLVPAPRSAPRKSGNLWPSLQICEALVKVGLGAEVVRALRRSEAVQKSAFAEKGARPDPEEHYRTTILDPNAPVIISQRVTLVDDFITRGSTFLGMQPRLKAAFRAREVGCFALIRTMSLQEIDAIRAPVHGTITNNHGHLVRRP